jgi:hypothetical protein
MKGGRREGAGRKLGSVARIDAEARQRAHAGGQTPLEFLSSIMRDQREDKRDRLDAAKAAAPYCHAQLASNIISADGEGGPVGIAVMEATDEMRARALAAFMAKTKFEARDAGERKFHVLAGRSPNQTASGRWREPDGCLSREAEGNALVDLRSHAPAM